MWLSKILVISYYTLLASLMVILYLLIIKLIHNSSLIHVRDLFLGTFVIWITTLILIPICLFLSENFGPFSGIIITCIGIVVAVLMAPESNWYLWPWSLNVRLMCPILKLRPNGLILENTSALLDPSVIPIGIIIGVVGFILLSILTSLWFAKRRLIKIMDLVRAIISNWMKTKRTAFRYIVVLVPVLFSMLFLACISTYKPDYTFQIKAYNLYFQVIGTGLPMMAGILTVLNIVGEDSAGEFKRLLIVPLSRNTIYLGKLFMIILITIIDMFVSVGIILLGIKFIYTEVYIQYGVFLEGTLFTTIASLFLYGLYLIISMEFGIGFTMQITVGGTLLGALMQTGLGDKVWQFIPWAWPGRLGIIPIFNLEKVEKFKDVDSNVLKNLFIEVLGQGIPIAVISFLVICIIGIVWFKRWEGMKSS
ncbi:lantibiotic immunity ABC transporter MutG family permease subunit (plasmid) [Paraclostridium bifermentans]|uniref:Lantibiotic immunity ABC transporter MutG family permease subunit n=1 Tax=Paraclostridium bifermentans TaxID=1490 RepID=A0ABY8R8L5_PARBF|nr:lantibiotic immunity ABC transporter MutG family permease subunit [Paraclostridium bifermentans]